MAAATEGDYGLGPETIHAIVENRFRKNWSGSKLTLTKQNIHDNYIAPLLDIIQERTQRRPLTEIMLGVNEFTWRGTEPLCAVLSSQPPFDRLVHLDVSNNALCDMGVIMIAEALQRNTTLTSLIISNVHCDDAGAAALGSALRVNKSLVALAVDENAFLEIDHSPRGKFRLADGYMQHPKLCKLNIGDSIFNRLDFVRLLIQVEKHARPSAEEEAGEEVNKFACFRMSVAEQKNVVIDYFLDAWRQYKKAGLPLFKLSKEHYKHILEYSLTLRVNDAKRRQKIEKEAAKVKGQLLEAATSNREGDISFKHAKFLVLGRLRGGKSCLIDSLIATRPSVAVNPTRCLRFRSLTIDSTVCMVYDFSGMREYKHMPAFFATPGSLAVVVVNLLAYRKEPAYYKKYVQYFIDLIHGTVCSPRILLIGTNADSNADIESKCEDIRENFDRDKAEAIKNYKQLINLMRTTNQNPDILWVKHNEENATVLFASPEMPEDEEAPQRTKTRVSKAIDAVRRRMSVSAAPAPTEQFVDPESPLAIAQTAQKLRPVLLDNRVYDVSSTDYSGMAYLRNELATRLNEPYTRTSQKLPAAYVYFGEYLEELGLADPVMPIEADQEWQAAERFCLADYFVGRDRVFSSLGEMKQALATLHDLGFILWYNNDDHLQNWVFLSRHWVGEQIRSVITHDMFTHVLPNVRAGFETAEQLQKKKVRFLNEGIIDANLLYGLGRWANATIQQRRLLVSLLKQLDLLAYMPEYPPQKGWAPQVEYLIPFYLHERIRQIAKIKEPRLLPPVPAALSRLFPQGRVTEPIDENLLKDRHVQYMYMFEHCFPHGVLQRLLVRMAPYVDIDYDLLSTTGAKVMDPAGNEFIIERQLGYEAWNAKKITGAVLITGIRQQSWRTFWNTMVLFQIQLEDLMTKSYPGVVAGVFIGMIRFRSDKPNLLVITRRSELEEYQLKSIKAGVASSTEELPFVFNTDLDVEFNPKLSRFLPELSQPVGRPLISQAQQGIFKVTEEDAEGSTTPGPLAPLDKPLRLQRKSYFAEIHAVLTNFEAQLDSEDSFRDQRLKIIHREILSIVLSLLKQLTIVKGGDAFGDIHSYLDFLETKNITGFLNWAAEIQNYHEISKRLFTNSEIKIQKAGVENVITACGGLLFTLRRLMGDDQPARPIVQCL